MMNRDERSNEKFRQDLHDRWLEEAQATQGPLPVDADRLWQKINQGLAREQARPLKSGGGRLKWGHWGLIGAAALALIVVLGRNGSPGLHSPTAPDDPSVNPMVEAQEDGWNPTASLHREPLQTPVHLESPRCDQTRQSCLFVAFL